jgi:hypothetical protein
VNWTIGQEGCRCGSDEAMRSSSAVRFRADNAQGRSAELAPRGHDRARPGQDAPLIEIRPGGDDDQPPVLVVEDVA